jgi:hypothetical protein
MSVFGPESVRDLGEIGLGTYINEACTAAERLTQERP